MIRALGSVMAAAVLAGCTGSGTPEGAASSLPATNSPVVSASAIASPTAAASASPTPRPLRSGAAGARCVNGWTEPAPGTPLRQKPLDLMRQLQGFAGTFQVIELRYFTGPEDPTIVEPRPASVERWYAKVVYPQDPSFRVRFLAVRRPQGEGIVAAAAYSTSGFRSPDWRAFEGEGGPSRKPGLPGVWPSGGDGSYDYVRSGELPPEVTGCLS